MFYGATSFDQNLCASGWDNVRLDGAKVGNFCFNAKCGDWEETCPK